MGEDSCFLAIPAVGLTFDGDGGGCWFTMWP
jgi:hypothetical protein